MRKKIFTILLALVASVGLMNAKVTWKSCNISDLDVYGTYESYSMEGVTLSAKANHIIARWEGYGDESHDGIRFMTDETGGFTFSNTLGKNFTKIEMTLNGYGGWDYANLGSGWNIVGDPWDVMKAIWTGKASTVDLVKDVSDFHGENVKRIEFYFEGDSEEPDPTYTVALQDGTANADKVTLSATSAEECTTVTVTPNEEYVITAFKATYNTTEELSTSFNAETDAYSFKMPAADVTIEATIALKLVPEGDIFAGFTATAGSGGFDNEGHANLVDNKFTSADWTKWCTNFDHMSVPTGETGDACWWIDFEASAALNLTGYILTTGNDTGNEHGRNPKNWVLKAKLNADDAWTTIATVNNDVTMKNQSFKDYKFFVDQSGPFQYFRFEVFANQGAGVMQLCELRLIGAEPAPTPAGNSITINESSHGSVVASSSSAAAGETITLTATPDEGYQLKSISGVYEAQGPLSETLNSVSSNTTTTGTKFQCVGTIAAGAKGWRVYNPGTANTLTVSSLNGATLIEKIELTSGWGNGRANNMLSVSAGTLSFNGTPATTVTINDINATSVTISGSGTNAAETWCITSVKVYYTGTIENELEISDTENANVKTFTMVDSEVTISAEFEPAPVLVTTHTLQLHVNDALMGSVALQNPSNDIVDNGDGTYTVPEGAEVTLLATPNEGYEFTGWKASSTICDFNECEFVALPTVDNPLTFDVYAEAAFMAEFAAVAPTNPEIKLNGKFSVADDKVVCFSKGNLQATTADNGTTWTWAFAADQLTFVGNATANTAINGNGTVSANGTVDLFGWSTAATKYGINNSLDNSTYSGDFVDWGSNPDLIASLGEGWRTLTSAEWTYLLKTRTTTSGVRYAKATVDGKNGLIILPDDWSESYHALASANTDDVAYTYNTFDAAIWSSDFEAHGAVFLPAAGYRRGKDVEHLGEFANYWSASPDGAEYAYYLAFSESFLLPAYNYNRVTGEAVRLVSDIAPDPAPQPQPAVEIGDQNNAEEVTAFLTTNDGQTIDELIIDRPVLNNMYNTLCLPFDMNATQIAASSLNGVEIREFTGASVEGTTLNLSVGDPVNAVVAGRPYFVKYSAASQLDDLHFEDVTINNALLDNMAVTFDGVTFKGTFTPFAMTNGLNFQGGYLFLGQNNQLFWPNTDNPLKPFRAYFYVDVEASTPGNAPKYRGMPARIVEGKNVVTGIENANLKSEIKNQKFIKDGQLIIIKNDVRYNAQGQVVK